MGSFKIVFVHGYTASSNADWYPAISPRLKKSNIDFVIPDLPGEEHPHAEEWLRVLHNEIIKTPKPLILVGHSLGTRTVLLYLEKYQPKNVRLALLIAAFANRLENSQRRGGNAYPDFFEHLIDINRVRSLSKKFIVMHSKDDDSIDYEQGVEIAKDLNAQLIAYNGRFHFCEPENALYVFEVLKNELKF